MLSALPTPHPPVRHSSCPGALNTALSLKAEVWIQWRLGFLVYMENFLEWHYLYFLCIVSSWKKGRAGLKSPCIYEVVKKVSLKAKINMLRGWRERNRSSCHMTPPHLKPSLLCSSNLRAGSPLFKHGLARNPALEVLKDSFPSECIIHLCPYNLLFPTFVVI